MLIKTANRTSVSYGSNGVCTWLTEARVSARDHRHAWAWFQQAHLFAVSCWGVDIDVCRRHGRHHCYPTISVAARQCVLPRDKLLQRVYRNCIHTYSNCPEAFFVTQACSRVSLLCSTFQREHEHEHVVKSKMGKWRYCKCSWQTHNITHSLTASVIDYTTHQRQRLLSGALTTIMNK